MDGPKLEGRHRPEIDGLRALAIIPVVLFHAGLGFPGGFMGVDVFFVISGFLIGGIILRELDAGRFSFAGFWERRIRRILPVLLFFFAVTIYAGWRILPPVELASLASQTLAGLCGVANFKMLAMTGGYWTTNANSIWLLHIWSLAVEEQFYLLLPIIMVVAHRWFQRRLDVVILALFTASLFLSLYWSEERYAGNFYLLPARAWELLLGCMGAWATHHRIALPKKLQSGAMAWGIGGILISAFILRDDSKWPDARTLLPTIATLLILISPAETGNAPLALRFLSLPPLRYIGWISYSLYLWHWPMIVLAGKPLSFQSRWGMVAASVALATLSWRFIEQPFRNKFRRLRVPTRSFLLGVSGAWMCLMAMAFATAKNPSQNAGETRPAFFNPPWRESMEAFDAKSRLADGGITFNLNARAPRCVVLGSSHGMMLGPVVRLLSDTYDIPCALFCQSGTSPLFVPPGDDSHAPRKIRETRERDKLVKKYLSEWKPDVIILAAKWNSEMTDWGRNLGPSWPSFPEDLSNTVSWLGQHSAHILLIGQVPQLPFHEGEDATTTLWQEYRDLGNVMPQLYEPQDVTAERVQALALFRNEAFTNVAVLDPTPFLKNADGSLRYYNRQGPFYFDYNHLNALGSKELRPLLEPFFKDLGTRAGHN